MPDGPDVGDPNTPASTLPVPAASGDADGPLRARYDERLGQANSASLGSAAIASWAPGSMSIE